MRKQYHFRRAGEDTLIWDVDRLVDLSSRLAPEMVPIAEVRELDEPYWFQTSGARPTCRAVVEHAKLIREADLTHPVILSRDGRVMDGMHRIGRALLEGRTEVAAVRFPEDPAPDFRNREADDLPYG